MKITNEILKALQGAIDSVGSISEFSHQTGVKLEILSRFLSRKTVSIRQETWNRIYPMLKTQLGDIELEADDEGEAPQLIGSNAKTHHDLASLSSDEKILLDAFSVLPPEEQQRFLASVSELATDTLRRTRGE